MRYNTLHEFKDWNTTISTRRNSLPFTVKIILPPPRKTGIIKVRDQLGRIVIAGIV